MDKYEYILKKNQAGNHVESRYHKSDLMLMTTFQLREICRKEKIIQGVIDPMDKEELVHVILRHLGADEYFLIRKEDEEGLQAVSQVFEECRMEERQDLHLKCSSKIIAHEGLAIGFYDGLTIPYDKRLAGTNAFVTGGDMTICAILNVIPMGSRTDCLYLTRAAELSCRESKVKNYSLYCMGRREPALPYRITAFTHNGEEVVLVRDLKRNTGSGMISRNMEDLTLKLYLKDLDGKARYQYTCRSTLSDFQEKVYEEIGKQYGSHIRQADTDDIVEQEVRFFVWAEPEEWAFSVVPVYRKDRRLYLGKEKRFLFENDGWVRNFFDGMK